MGLNIFLSNFYYIKGGLNIEGENDSYDFGTGIILLFFYKCSYI